MALLAEGTSYIHQEILPQHVLLTDSSVVATDARDIVEKYVSLSSGTRDRIRTALKRLHQALIRSEPADSTVELSIALEALLIDSPGEHTFKLSQRAALLVSEDVEKRKEAKAIIRAAYNIRSSLMHHGRRSKPLTVVEGQEKMSAEEIAREAAKIKLFK